MRDRRVRRQKSERPSWQASPVGGGSQGRSEVPFKTRAQSSNVLQHLAKLLRCRSYNCDEVGLAKPALHAMAPQVTARAAMKHRGVSSSDAGLADVQSERKHAAPIAVVRVERVARQFHGFQFKLGKQILEARRLLLEVTIDVAKRLGDFVRDRDAILDQTESQSGLQQHEACTNLLDERAPQVPHAWVVRHD